MVLTRTFKAISLVTWLTATLERAGQVYTVGIWMTSYSFWQLAFVNVCKAPPQKLDVILQTYAVTITVADPINEQLLLLLLLLL